jgi:hypothetical protein
MRLIYSLFLSSLLVACATTAIPTEDAKRTTKVLDTTMTTARVGAGKLIIKRDAGFLGSGCAIRAFANGKPFADLRTEEVVTVYLDPGEYVLRAASTGICGGGDAESALSIQAGATRTYRIGIDQGGSIRLGPTAQ